MKGIIIAGGAGTRLRPLTYTRPKPLIPVVNRPFLEYQVALLKRHGIDEIIFCTNYMADKIQNHFGDGSRFGVSMRYAIEEQPLGTAGAIKNAQNIAGRDTLVVLNGDVLTDFDIGSVIRFHKEKDALVTLTLKEVPSPSPYGVILTDATGRVQEFREPSEAQKKALAANPHVEHTGVDPINAGIYVMQPEALDAIPPAGRFPSSAKRIRSCWPRVGPCTRWCAKASGLTSGGRNSTGMPPTRFCVAKSAWTYPASGRRPATGRRTVPILTPPPISRRPYTSGRTRGSGRAPR
jgi:NDP-sugar pyrophosphorylase family protein